jgi:hypothetical protein
MTNIDDRVAQARAAAAAALTPETARLLRDGMHVRENGSVVLDVDAPNAALAEIAQFFDQLGFPLQYKPARVALNDIWGQLDEVLGWVAQEECAVEIDLGGALVHVNPGPAPVEDVGAAVLAQRLPRRDARGPQLAGRPPGPAPV